MRHVYFSILSLLLFLTGTKYSPCNNQAAIDSLENVLLNTKEEKSIPILGSLSKAYHSIDLNKSLNYAQKALELSRKYRNEEQIAFSNMYIACTYFEMSRFKLAIEFYEKALDYFYEEKIPDNKIYVFTQLGHSEKFLSNYDNALFYYQKPLNLYLVHKNDKISEAYNNIGIIYKMLGLHTKSLEYHEKALTASNTAFNQKEIANTLKYIGSTYWQNSKYDSSLFYFEKALEIYREITDTLGEATILSNIGIVYKNTGEFKKALDYNLKALDLRIKKGYKKDIAHSYNIIGSIYLAVNDIENARDFYLKSLTIRENINDLLGIAQSQNNIALVYRKLNDYDKALEYQNKSLDNYYKTGNKLLIANSINQIGNIFKRLNKFDLALKSYLDALKLKQEIGDQNEIASVFTNIGIIYDDINNYAKALESYSKSLELKRKTGNIKEIAYSLHIIGNTYLKLRNYNEALKYYNESLKLRQETGDKVNIANSLKSIGNTYLKLGDYTNSIINLNNALELREDIGDIKGVSDILNDLGNYYNTADNHEKAIEYFNMTIDVCKKTGDQYLTALCKRKIGALKIRKGFYQEGVDYLNESLQIGQELNNFELIKNAYYELYVYYNRIGNKDKALENYINYTVIKDSITAKFNSQRLVEIQMNFELEESQSEISRIENEISELTFEKKLSELELIKQRNVRNLLYIIILISFASGILIFNQFLSKRKTNILLREKINEADKANKLLKESEENLKILNATKDKFFSIIAHDLRNPFNALHGLTKHLLNNYNEFNPDEVQDSLEIIYRSADDLLELLENLLYWSRTQRGKMQFNPKEINLPELINKNFNLLSMNAQKKDINLINEIESNITILADYDMLTAILRNLISNAIKFSHNNSFIRVSTKNYDEYIEISVMDNGIGINKHDLKKLFRIDVHHSTSGTYEEQGSGLGLILCKEFVEKHDGKIWAESEINKGSTFKFTISKNIQV